MKDKLFPHVMKGVSEIVPFLIVAGLFIGINELLFILSISNPFFNQLLPIGQSIYHYMIPLFAAFIAFSIGDKVAFVPGFLGGVFVVFNEEGLIFAILIGLCAGYIVLGLKYALRKLPTSLHSIKSLILIPFIASIFIVLIAQFLFLFMPYITQLINSILTTSEGYLIFIIASLSALFMAYDMGGKVNKIMFLLAIISISYGEKTILMAAVMAGGMTPPLGIALFHFIFKNRFNDELKIQANKNFIYGLSFITEGAIPFALSNKKAVMPSIILGSMLAGFLIALFQTKSSIPHGGILVVPWMQNWWGFLIAIVAGSFLTMILLSFLWKKNNKV
jgi:fructose PTS system EIIBC or EIIC component